VLTKVLDTRQICLKLLSNVTYGYTAASFSGRMPLVEIGDAIVSMGRSILENAIQMISQHPSWNARVVYGDTGAYFLHPLYQHIYIFIVYFHEFRTGGVSYIKSFKNYQIQYSFRSRMVPKRELSK
ncbi:hypothetical protein HMI55_005923, partial [Coelomomyces lativittatus]